MNKDFYGSPWFRRETADSIHYSRKLLTTYSEKPPAKYGSVIQRRQNVVYVSFNTTE